MNIPLSFWIILFPAVNSLSSLLHGTQCSLECESLAKRPICASNDVTYNNRCELDKVNCLSKDRIRVQYRGPCLKEKQRCFEERAEAIKTSNESGIPIFIPICKEDGTYVEAQCHYGTGYCWCVNSHGKPISGSSIRYDKPNCTMKNKSRRSHRARKMKQMKSRKSCSSSERTKFNKFLLEILSNEYQRALGSLSDKKKEIGNWKFTQMDSDKDGFVKQRDFKDFRNLVKQLSRQKMCATTLWAYCDMNNDKRLTSSEWTTCLGLDINVSFKLFLSLNSKEEKEGDKKRNGKKHKKRKEEDQEENDQAEKEEIKRKKEQEEEKESQFEESVSSQTLVARQDDDKMTPLKDCFVEHENARRASRAGNDDIYIPECTSSGKYKEIQCYRSSGYCWCSHSQTGAPIPGTSIKNGIPNCSSMPEIQIPLPNSWTKCPQPLKRQFQQDLLDFLTKEMVDENQNENLNTDPSLSFEEKVSEWKFRQLDQDQNEILSWKELRFLKINLSKDSRLKRCGRRIQLHCDLNIDKRISLHEWAVCIGAKEETFRDMFATQHVTSGKRKGVNPLKKYLISD